MHVLVSTPMNTILDLPAQKLIAPTDHGFHCFLPHHADGAAGLVIGVSEILTEDQRTVFVAHGAGVLVKCGNEIRVAVEEAAASDALSDLKARIETIEARAAADAAKAGSAVARLEAGLIRRLVDLERRHDAF